MKFLKPGLHVSCKNGKHTVANMFLKLFTYAFVFGLHIVVMITCNSIHISQEMFAIDVLTALKSSLEQRRKHVLGLLRLHGDQAHQLNKICLIFNHITMKIKSFFEIS